MRRIIAHGKDHAAMPLGREKFFWGSGFTVAFFTHGEHLVPRSSV
jgi:hypothetical protein